ncbi:MAG: DNA-processing protein DprA [Planctomycetota bacterium]
MPTEDALVAVTLCSRLGRGAQTRALDARTWTDVVRALQAADRASPGALIGQQASALQESFGLSASLSERVELLLRGLGSASMEVERLSTIGIWTLTRGDAAYPTLWKQRLGPAAPPVVFGAGDRARLRGNLVALLGGRGGSASHRAFARTLGESCARDGWSVVTAGRRGVEEESTAACLAAGGGAVEFPADSVERAVARKTNREAIVDGRLTVLSASLPEERGGEDRVRLVHTLARYACALDGEPAALEGSGGPVPVRPGEGDVRLDPAAPVEELFAAGERPPEQGEFEF